MPLSNPATNVVAVGARMPRPHEWYDTVLAPDAESVMLEAYALGHGPVVTFNADNPEPYRFVVRCSCAWDDVRSSLGRAWAAWLDHAAAAVRDRT